jgi:nucleoside-diphosphate-sugar epimerase
MDKEKVLLLGASGTMGYAAFKELWKRKDRYDVIILARPSGKNKKLFRPYEQEAGIAAIPGRGLVEGNGFKIVWGDATEYDDVEAAVLGVDWVLNAMAFISPQADYYPEVARAVNTDAIVHIVRAIEAQPNGAERIRLVHTGTVAETGDRLGSIHWGRVGDPLKPSIFDYYAVTKIAGERAVLESGIKHWASLRMTYIMPTDYKDYNSLRDPIMFHQPIDSFMENLSDRDAGYGLINCLDIPGESDFWRRVYNMGGGPGMRCTAYDYADWTFQLLGLSGIEACAERNWFALRNFHMQYYEDSDVLNEYLHHWRDDLDAYWEALFAAMPASMKALAFLCRHVPLIRMQVEKATYQMMKEWAENHRNGTVYWYNQRCGQRITAFYKDYETYESIPGWGLDMPQMDPEPEWHRLDHGYDESKAQLDLGDLRGAARFRGGECLSSVWDGDIFSTLAWKCAFGHEFTGKPSTILKAGHWCPVCVAPPWSFDAIARQNPFFAQVWYPNHDKDEDNVYLEDCLQDIAGADKDHG